MSSARRSCNADRAPQPPVAVERRSLSAAGVTQRQRRTAARPRRTPAVPATAHVTGTASFVATARPSSARGDRVGGFASRRRGGPAVFGLALLRAVSAAARAVLWVPARSPVRLPPLDGRCAARSDDAVERWTTVLRWAVPDRSISVAARAGLWVPGRLPPLDGLCAARSDVAAERWTTVLPWVVPDRFDRAVGAGGRLVAELRRGCVLRSRPASAAAGFEARSGPASTAAGFEARSVRSTRPSSDTGRNATRRPSSGALPQLSSGVLRRPSSGP